MQNQPRPRAVPRGLGCTPGKCPLPQRISQSAPGRGVIRGLPDLGPALGPVWELGTGNPVLWVLMGSRVIKGLEDVEVGGERLELC